MVYFIVPKRNEYQNNMKQNNHEYQNTFACFLTMPIADLLPKEAYIFITTLDDSQ